MPEVLPRQGFYLDAFQTLCEWRSVTGMGDLAPISMNDMLSYFAIYKIESVEVRDNLMHQIKPMDIFYLNNRAERAKADKPEVE
jgi:hypothetical protein